MSHLVQRNDVQTISWQSWPFLVLSFGQHHDAVQSLRWNLSVPTAFEWPSFPAEFKYAVCTTLWHDCVWKYVIWHFRVAPRHWSCQRIPPTCPLHAKRGTVGLCTSMTDVSLPIFFRPTLIFAQVLHLRRLKWQVQLWSHRSQVPCDLGIVHWRIALLHIRQYLPCSLSSFRSEIPKSSLVQSFRVCFTVCSECHSSPPAANVGTFHRSIISARAAFWSCRDITWRIPCAQMCATFCESFFHTWLKSFWKL